MIGRTLTLETCAELAALGDELGSSDPEVRAQAASLLFDGLASEGLSVGALVHFRRQWGPRPDLSRAVDLIARHFATEIHPHAENQRWNGESIAAIELCRDAEGRHRPAEILRILGMFAVACGETMDPDIPLET